MHFILNHIKVVEREMRSFFFFLNAEKLIDY